MAPAKDLSITSDLTQEAAEYYDAYLFGLAYLALDPSVENIYLISHYDSLTGGNVYPPGDESL